MKKLFASISGLMFAFALGCGSDAGNSGAGLLGLAGAGEGGKVSFAFDQQNAPSALMSIAGPVNAPDVTAVVVTIQDAMGNVVYNMKSIPLVSFGGQYISQPLTLPVGSYHLTQFLAVNSSGTALYATPVEGSAVAYLVSDPLPIDFTITKNQVSKLVPEVLSTETFTPADFGYATFSFDIVETIDFLVDALVFNKTTLNYEITDAVITVSSSGTTIFSGSIPAAVTAVKVNDGYDSYTVTISKNGYVDFMNTYNNDQLKGFTGDPLCAMLEPLKDITSFSINGVSGAYAGTGISLTLPHGTNPNGLVAVFSTNGESVSINGVTQVSGVTANNFSAPVVYTVHALDGTIRNFTVTVTVARDTAKDLTGFSINGVAGEFTLHSIELTLPYGTSCSGLVAVFETTGESVTVDGAVQVSGSTANNFSSSVTYTVHAEDGSTADYTVTVFIEELNFSNIFEGFESGSVSQFTLTNSGSTPWSVISGSAYAGSYGLKVGPSTCGSNCFKNYAVRLTKTFTVPVSTISVHLKYRRNNGWGCYTGVWINNPNPVDNTGLVVWDQNNQWVTGSTWGDLTLSYTGTIYSVTLQFEDVTSTNWFDIDNIDFTYGR
jgi:hypothetical protein